MIGPARVVDREALGTNAEEVLGLVVAHVLEVELDAPLEQRGPDVVDDEARLLEQLARARPPRATRLRRRRRPGVSHHVPSSGRPGSKPRNSRT